MQVIVDLRTTAVVHRCSGITMAWYDAYGSGYGLQVG